MNEEIDYENRYVIESPISGRILITLKYTSVSPGFEQEIYNKLYEKIGSKPEDVPRSKVESTLQQYVLPSINEDWEGIPLKDSQTLQLGEYEKPR